MMEPGFWIPYRTSDPRHPCIVVGPFDSIHHANIASASMRRAAQPAEYVGEVFFAASETEALVVATKALPTTP